MLNKMMAFEWICSVGNHTWLFTETRSRSPVRIEPPKAASMAGFAVRNENQRPSSQPEDPAGRYF